jgi:DNA-binding transcriptional regulator YiaG
MTPEQVRLWRWEHNLTQHQLAEHLHVRVLAIKRWESGTRTPPVYLRLALERLDQLLQGERLPEEIGR